ncbi:MULTISPECIES: T9SS type A sorting domain-containing protein [unclassified Chryseobacterium]|uniref:T9SS type A sorting domain-containing protein n=1 Tax=unclassified Chryseobacterium TaxID=2593645 RepID=UPI0021E5B7C0|nr:MULTISPECIES: T9SS type A sorting domain-containing protein [unclassified Chryseobacterium]MEA1851289.1 T9SS type A sorting domain-containing protein [Chryseobacterium sp. MHB01]
MKKVLSVLFLSSYLIGFGQAQTLINENYNTLTNGNLATDPTGATAGQSGWYIYQGAASDYQVTTIDASHGKSINLTTGAGAPPSTGANTNNRYAYKGITTTATAANNLVMAQMEIYTGSATGKGRVGLQLYSSAAQIGGIVYDYETKKIYGQARVTVVATPTQTGILNLGLGAEVFPANTWVTVRYIYNKTTGAHSFIYTNGTTSASYSFTGNTTYSIFTGDVASEFDAVNTTLATNTVANTAGVDNVNVQFTNQALLGVDDIGKPKNAQVLLAIYPNPTTDVINIKSEDKIKKVHVTDLSGKNIDVKLNGNIVDVRHLSVGTYFISVETINGLVTEKFIKK